MRRWLMVLCLLLGGVSLAWGQSPPPTVTDNAGVTCRPAFTTIFSPGFLSCGTSADGQPAAIVNMGATPPPTVGFNNVTTGTNTTNLTVGTGGRLGPTGTGIIEANRHLPAGAAGNCVSWGAGGALSDAGGPCSAQTPTPNLTDLADVTITSPLTGQPLIKSGTDWINGALDLGNTDAVTGTLPDVRVTDVLTIAGAGNVDATSLKSGTIPPARVGPDHISAITQIAAGLKAGTGGLLAMTPSLGVAGNCVEWAVGGLGDAGAPCGSGGGADELVKVSANDTTAGFLSAKLVAGTNITLTPSGPGNETLTIDAASGTNNPGAPVGSFQIHGVGGVFQGIGSHDTGTDASTFPGSVAAGGTGAGRIELNNIAGTFNNAFEAPDTSTANRTCKLLDADAMIPSSCVQGGGGATPVYESVFDAASCTATGTATTNWDFDPNATTPPAACAEGTNVAYGVLQFADTGTSCVQRKTRLHADFAGPLLVEITWESAAITGDVRWSAAVACRAIGDTLNGVTFNTALELTDAANGTATGQNVASITPVDVTGCAGNNTMYFRVCRLGDDAADTMTGTADAALVRYRYARQ